MENIQDLNPSRWSSRATTYHYIEKHNFMIGLSLYRMLKIDSSSENIIEVGCGPGMLTFYMLENMPQNVDLLSVDIAPGMIEFARKTKEGLRDKFNSRKQTFEVMDA